MANGVANSHEEQSGNVPRIKDVLGEALPRVGTYKHLDNTKQVVALIDDVSSLSSLSFSTKTTVSLLEWFFGFSNISQ